MPATVNVNGRLFDQEHAVVSVFDHGFLFGEGVYETWRTYNGQPFLFDRHMRRLRNSSGMLELPVPLTRTIKWTGDAARRCAPRGWAIRREATPARCTSGSCSHAASASSRTTRPAVRRPRLVIIVKPLVVAAAGGL